MKTTTLFFIAILLLAPHLHAADTQPANPPAPAVAPLLHDRDGAVVPKSVEYLITTDKPKYLLGESVRIYYEVKNGSSKTVTIELGADYRFIGRSKRLIVELAGPDGTPMQDPGIHEHRYGGGVVSRIEIKPGESACLSEQLMSYRIPVGAGKYTLRAAHDLGFTFGPPPKERKLFDFGSPISADDIRWATAQVEFVMPDEEQAKAVIQAMGKLDQGNPGIGIKLPPSQDFSALRYAVYLPELVRLAAEGDIRAYQGIGASFTPRATEILIAGIESPDDKIHTAAYAQLFDRIPGQGMENGPDRARIAYLKQLQTLSWKDAYKEPLLAWAVRTLENDPAQTLDNPRSYRALTLIGAIGGQGQLPLVLDTFDRFLARSVQTGPGDNWHSSHSGNTFLQFQTCLKSLLSRGVKLDNESSTPARVAASIISRRGKPPIDVAEQKIHLGWLDHEIPCIQKMAIEALPTPCPDWAKESLARKFATPHAIVQEAAINRAGTSKDPAFAPTMLKVLQTAELRPALVAFYNLSYVGVPRDKALEAWVARLDGDFTSADDVELVMRPLLTALNHPSRIGPLPDNAMKKQWREKMKTAWLNFINQNRQALIDLKTLPPTAPGYCKELFPQGQIIEFPK